MARSAASKEALNGTAVSRNLAARSAALSRHLVLWDNMLVAQALTPKNGP